MAATEAASRPRGQGSLVAVGVLAVSLLAWLWLEAWSPPSSSTLLHAHPVSFDLPAFLGTLPMWWAMMLAMMLPPSLPWFVLLGRLDRGEVSVVSFGLGFVAVWLCYGIAAAGVQLSLSRFAWLGRDLALAPPWSGVVLLAAGAFQLTPLKHACLSRCRNPLSYFLTHWREGRWGSFRMGLGHGADCVRCCFALMATAFALGVMNLSWMAVLSVLLCIENLAPRGHLAGRAAGMGLLAWGAVVTLSQYSVE